MSKNRHWTPRSGFFPCAAKENCPKSSQHNNAGKTVPEIKSNFRSAENQARTAMLNGEIDSAQYNKVVGALRNDTAASLKEVRAANKANELEEKPKKKFISTSLTRGISAFVGGAILVGSLTGCGVTVAELPDPSADQGDSKSVVQTLDDAEKINVHKSVFTLGDHWNVSADGQGVGELKGQTIPVLGDTYSMYSKDGNVVGSEAEQTLQALHGATTYDQNNKERGVIDQNLSLIISNYTIRDAKGNIVGTAQQNLNMTLNFDIKNADGKVEYKVSKAMFSWGASLDIERQVSNPDVSAQDAVWISVIANEVSE